MFRVNCLLTTLLLCAPVLAQDLITFDDQGWNADQSLDSNFTIGNFLYSSNKNFYTNYGYNFDVYNVSIFFVFQNKEVDQITITTVDNEPVKLNSLALYQVSEKSTDSLIIEGWNGTTKEYSQKFANDTTWRILTLNYENVNKVVIKLDSAGNGGISDFNFDNFSFNDRIISVELIEFKARTEKNYVMLEWKTATELNNYGFDIERKDSIISWQKIGFINGNGTSTTPKSYTFSDNIVKNGYKYKYRLKQIDINGDYKYSSEIEVVANLLPATYSLSQNYPNPFNPSTVINYQIPQAGKVTIKIYDIIGNEITTIVNEYKDAGSYSVTFSANGGSLSAGSHGASGGNAETLSSGIYIYKLIAGGFVSSKKMMLIK